MRPCRQHALVARFAVAALLCAAVPAPAAEGRPEVLKDVGFDQRLDEQVPLDLTFRDETGAAVALGTYFRAKPVILVLAYYECPMLCTLVLNGLTGALKALPFDLGREYEVVTVSINPDDTPALASAKKANYLARYGRPGAEAGWHFLTGEADAIARLARAVGFRYTYVPEQKQFAHAAGIMVLTPQGKIARYFYGIEFAPRDLRLGLVEAAQGRIGTPVDQILLFCFHYDPVTGSYSALAMNAVRVAGAITVAVVAGLLLVYLRREARARQLTLRT
jgi:protein SCO1/2